MRTYTARTFNLDEQTVTIDFAIHEPVGPATNWALNAKKGDPIGLVGPGPLKYDPSKGDWYLFCADMAALPAAISVMESLKADAKGFAFLEITGELDKQELSIPEGIAVKWLLHSHPEKKSQQQLQEIKSLSFPDGVPNIFVAGELSTIREIKSHILSIGMDDAFLYISSYWKIGLKEEEHKEAKRTMILD